jgi:D-glycero-D-manno-heptose 1,7-bisphosphate phosphatase
MPHAHSAAFLDRDGTIIEEKHYIADPDDVVLAQGAMAGLRELRAAGFKLVIVTNQSGIARGLYAETDFHAVQRRLTELLAEQGITIDGVYYCPHHPDFTGPCACRKPGLGMYRAAERNLGIDLARSVYIGDRMKDVLPARELGGLGILVRSGYGADEADQAPHWVEVADDLVAAARIAGKPRGSSLL